jgi:hypothetical protein
MGGKRKSRVVGPEVERLGDSPRLPFFPRPIAHPSASLTVLSDPSFALPPPTPSLFPSPPRWRSAHGGLLQLHWGAAMREGGPQELVPSGWRTNSGSTWESSEGTLATPFALLDVQRLDIGTLSKVRMLICMCIGRTRGKRESRCEQFTRTLTLSHTHTLFLAFSQVKPRFLVSTYDSEDEETRSVLNNNNHNNHNNGNNNGAPRHRQAHVVLLQLSLSNASLRHGGLAFTLKDAKGRLLNNAKNGHAFFVELLPGLQ